MLLVTKQLKKIRINRLLAPSKTRYFLQNSQTFLGKGLAGSIVVKNKDRLFLIANKITKELLDTILREVVLALRVSKYEEHRVDQIQAKELRDIQTRRKGILVEVIIILPKNLKEIQKGIIDFKVNRMHIS